MTSAYVDDDSQAFRSWVGVDVDCTTSPKECSSPSKSSSSSSSSSSFFFVFSPCVELMLPT
ncbi:hypothetical protein WG66_007703 [Moniliophthora roreri]|nr:hypothetical protein WG66_007703 [Moniliophthora roreri]